MRSVRASSSGPSTAVAWAAKASRKAVEVLGLAAPARRRPGGRRSAPGARRRPRAPPSRSKPGMLRPEPRPPPSLVEGDHDRGPVVALDQPRGDDPDHAGVPALAGDAPAPAPRAGRSGSSRRAASAAASTSRSVARRSRVGAARARRRSAAARAGVLGQHQLDPGVGPVEPPGGVDPRRQAERRGRPRRAVVGSHFEAAISARIPGRRARRSSASPRLHQRPVLADQRHHVGDRRQRHQVEVGLGGLLAQPAPRSAARRPASRRPPVPHSSANG